jgi:hypothetical protein
MEVVAIAALLLLLWRLVNKKKVLQVESEKKIIDPDEQLAGDPNWNLNTYCKNIVYRPLTNKDLRTDPLLVGWCSKGDSFIDPTKGFGDQYSDDQAKVYQEMKDNEAKFIASRDFVQFRLINSTSGKITTNLLNSTQDSTIFGAAPSVPVNNVITGIGLSGLTANWSASALASGYYLDIATDSNFTAFVVGYNNKDVGNVLTSPVTGLSSSTKYYSRVRAYNASGTSASSNSISAYTSFNDFFLPSQDEMDRMRVTLYLFGVGNFTTGGDYWTSTENSNIWADKEYMFDGTQTVAGKGSLLYSRACRTFTSPDVYSLRDTGPAGGWIFNIVNNGNGTFTYMEAYTSDFAVAAWSNVTGTLIGPTAQGTAIGTGKANTAAIIAQPGHTASAALLCTNIIV